MNPEMLLKAWWQGASFKEVAVPFRKRQHGVAKGTRLRFVLGSIVDIWMFWFRWIVLGRRPHKGRGRVSARRPLDATDVAIVIVMLGLAAVFAPGLLLPEVPLPQDQHARVSLDIALTRAMCGTVKSVHSTALISGEYPFEPSGRRIDSTQAARRAGDWRGRQLLPRCR